MIGLLKGMQATISHLLTKKVTVQYPEERRQLPERSRGLFRLRLKPDAMDAEVHLLHFLRADLPVGGDQDHLREQAAGEGLDAWTPAPARCFHISIAAKNRWGWKIWPEKADATAAPDRDGCLASSLLDAPGGFSPLVLAKTASRNGVWLAQVFGVATFYDQLRPGAPERRLEERRCRRRHVATVPGCPGDPAGQPRRDRSRRASTPTRPPAATRPPPSALIRDEPRRGGR